MLRFSKAGLALLGGAVLLAGSLEPAMAVRCEKISATNSGKSKGEAVRAAQQNARDTARQVKYKRGWSYVTLRPKMVAPDPFWKSVRPEVRSEMLLKPDVVTSESYTQCWRGVVVPFVCTAGAAACGG